MSDEGEIVMVRKVKVVTKKVVTTTTMSQPPKVKVPIIKHIRVIVK